MPLTSPYILFVSMDVEPDKETIFNEVYDQEHVPLLTTVPGVISVARFKSDELSIVIGGERRTIVVEDEPKYSVLWELESPDVLTSEAWSRAVDQGRWSTHVRPYTKNRRHLLKRRMAPGTK